MRPARFVACAFHPINNLLSKKLVDPVNKFFILSTRIPVFLQVVVVTCSHCWTVSLCVLFLVSIQPSISIDRVYPDLIRQPGAFSGPFTRLACGLVTRLDCCTATKPDSLVSPESRRLFRQFNVIGRHTGICRLPTASRQSNAGHGESGLQRSSRAILAGLSI